ncbi:hypothetical protein D3C71_1968610 [compost metagenome]
MNAPGGQGGFAADQGDEGVVQCIEFSGDGLEEFGATFGRQMTESRVGRGGCFGRCVHFFDGGRVKAIRQGFAAFGIKALQGAGALGRASTCNVVVAGNFKHGNS